MNDSEDDWIRDFAPRPEPTAEPALTVDIIEGVEPLDGQFGVDAPKTVPDALFDAVFGQPEPTEAEVRAAGGDMLKIPPLNTYAILDAAKVDNLPELLETSGLDHCCLFKGNAYDEFKDVAPWIVRLEESNAFTRSLFTRSDAPWHLWDTEPGIYLRSCASLDALWKHFRKYTKVQDESGKWFYFRFWEPTILPLLEPDLAAEILEKLLPVDSGSGRASALVAGNCARFSVFRPHIPDVSSGPLRLQSRILKALGDATHRRNRDLEIAALRSELPRKMHRSIDGQWLGSVVDWLVASGFKDPSQRSAAAYLYTIASLENRAQDAGHILSHTASGPGIRLWKLEKMLEGP